MDSAWISAFSAVMGSLVGGFTSFVTTYTNQRHQYRRDFLSKQFTQRETLYSEFINEAARLQVECKRQSSYTGEEARSAISAQMFQTLSLATVTRSTKNHGDYDKSHRERRHRSIIIANLELGFCLEVHVPCHILEEFNERYFVRTPSPPSAVRLWRSSV